MIPLLAELFPFHLAIGADSRLLRVGPSLAKAWPEAQAGTLLPEIAQIERPSTPATWESLVPLTGTVLLVAASGLRLRGQVKQDGDELMFLGSPVVQDLAELGTLHLGLSDFAPHDATVDTLMLLQTRSVALRDAQRLAERLQQRQRQLETARLAAEAASRAKSEFLTNMSHEIRTPMNGVVGMTELLIGSPLSDAQREYVATLSTCSGVLMSILNDVLDLSKIEAGGLVLAQSPFHPREILEDVMAVHAATAHAKGLDFYLEAETAPARLNGDAHRFRQIANNLIENAVKFTPSGEVEVRLTPGERGVVLTVRDTGVGIDPDRHAEVFESFTQADGSLSRKFGGAGLGLAISRRLVELMGGTLTLKSTLRVGTEFTAEIPLEATPGEREDGSPQILQGRSVALVDDARGSRKNLAYQLRRLGGNVCEVEAGELQNLASSQYDLVLLSEKLASPETIEAITGRSNLILLSLVGDLSAREGSPRTAARLTKPIRRASLLHLLRSALHTEVPEKKTAPVENSCLGLRVLVVDDNPVNLKVTRRMVESFGCAVSLADGGAAAVDAAHRGGIDLILMDVQMPEVDGLAATERIRALKGPPSTVQIVALTANALLGDRERCLAAGMDGYLTKPLRRDTLAETLHGLAGQLAAA